MSEIRDYNEEDIMHVASKRGKRRTQMQDLERYQGLDFGSKMAFTAGVSYISAGTLGFLKGIYYGLPSNWKLPRKLIINNFFNSCGKETTRYGNAAAASAFIYVATASFLTLTNEEEFEDMSDLSKNMICGTVTGAIYKCTLGPIPTVVGAILGGSIIGGLTLLNQQAYEKGFIRFEMKI